LKGEFVAESHDMTLVVIGQGDQTVKIRYFADTDTLYVQLNDREVVDTHEINENTILDLDAKGNLVALTLEHARETANILDFSFQQALHPSVQYAEKG
jgi:uncharacterized protein YuzE